ncbi:Uncharacterized protein DAT39_004209 [Clarias magur]|uniref:Uncharacterized protein n=1 Tax=Clarias magur TaxID=1594786 RepID=A0A8J4X8V8_CLAMG|nr:Uncharacterized protein DAT39_004209 [Clarias magur]
MPALAGALSVCPVDGVRSWPPSCRRKWKRGGGGTRTWSGKNVLVVGGAIKGVSRMLVSSGIAESFHRKVRNTYSKPESLGACV